MTASSSCCTAARSDESSEMDLSSPAASLTLYLTS
eukprot:CAMPEP_0179091732 /NCGR_PEP_ID=MMETSP0796-20121207/41920_1 /TAXON_ID=73915 /ORGANISM="Pyrodinium bahamense, Strain pbaha01" /LENGTH=34 /DNA_ID= /DNA_START= /DNA_END= /DNA_ORIENTATION=